MLKQRLHSSNFGKRTSLTSLLSIILDKRDKKVFGNSTQSNTYTIITVIKNAVKNVLINFNVINWLLMIYKENQE